MGPSSDAKHHSYADFCKIGWGRGQRHPTQHVPNGFSRWGPVSVCSCDQITKQKQPLSHLSQGQNEVPEQGALSGGSETGRKNEAEESKCLGK